MATLTPYLSFRDDAREAMTFYQSVLGGTLDVVEFAAFPGAMQDPADEHRVMHAYLETPDGMVLMGADTPTGMEYRAPQGVSVTVSADAERARGIWEALGEGGTVTMPYGTPPWGGEFGMVTDRFGVEWMVMGDSEA